MTYETNGLTYTDLVSRMRVRADTVDFKLTQEEVRMGRPSRYDHDSEMTRLEWLPTDVSGEILIQVDPPLQDDEFHEDDIQDAVIQVCWDEIHYTPADIELDWAYVVVFGGAGIRCIPKVSR